MPELKLRVTQQEYEAFADTAYRRGRMKHQHALKQAVEQWMSQERAENPPKPGDMAGEQGKAPQYVDARKIDAELRSSDNVAAGAAIPQDPSESNIRREDAASRAFEERLAALEAKVAGSRKGDSGARRGKQVRRK